MPARASVLDGQQSQITQSTRVPAVSSIRTCGRLDSTVMTARRQRIGTTEGCGRRPGAGRELNDRIAQADVPIRSRSSNVVYPVRGKRGPGPSPPDPRRASPPTMRVETQADPLPDGTELYRIE
eukprot:2670420-Prymnesium_polylepis.1